MQDMMWPRSNADIRACDKNSKYRIDLRCTGDVSTNFAEYGREVL